MKKAAPPGDPFFRCPAAPPIGLVLEELDEKAHHVGHHEVPEGHPCSEKHHGHDDDDRGVEKFLEFFKSFFLRVPRPRRFLELEAYFSEELAGFAEHV